MTLPGTATIPALTARRAVVSEETGRRAVEIALADLRPSQVLTPAAFDNAITVLCALGGSTNAVVHLLALARPHRLRAAARALRRAVAAHAGARRRASGRRAPGRQARRRRRRAGGAARARRPARPRRDHDRRIDHRRVPRSRASARVVRSLDRSGQAGRRARRPARLARARGAVLKVASADPALLRHRGPAVVFDGVDDVAARIDDPALDIDADSVLVLRSVGPVGAPGMPEWGMVPIPERLLRAGVRDMVRISDARMSGTAFGTCVLHVAPESYAGGPLAAVRDGDMIALDIDARTIDLEVDPAEIERRLAERPAPVAALHARLRPAARRPRPAGRRGLRPRLPRRRAGGGAPAALRPLRRVGRRLVTEPPRRPKRQPA